MTRSLFVLLAGAVYLGACSAAGASLPPAGGIDGRTFLSTQVTGFDLVPGTQVRLTFTDGDVSAQAGCNIMGGTYSIDGDRLTTTQMFMTEMGCDGPRQAQDEWLAAFLGNVMFTLDGDTLVLTDGTVRLSLTDKEVVTPDQTLEGTRWVLDGVVSGDAVSSVPIGVTASITIADGRVDVEAGCNMGGGAVEVTPDTIAFGPIATTKMACEAGPTSVETAVLGVLSGPVRYTIDADAVAGCPREPPEGSSPVGSVAGCPREPPEGSSPVGSVAGCPREPPEGSSPVGSVPELVKPCVSPGGLTTTCPPSTTTVSSPILNVAYPDSTTKTSAYGWRWSFGPTPGCEWTRITQNGTSPCSAPTNSGSTNGPSSRHV